LTITIDGAPSLAARTCTRASTVPLVYVTAQIGRDPKTGDFVKEDSRRSSTRQSTM